MYRCAVVYEMLLTVGGAVACLVGWRWYLASEERKAKLDAEARERRAEIYAQRDMAVSRAEMAAERYGFDPAPAIDGFDLGALMQNPVVMNALSSFLAKNAGAGASQTASTPNEVKL